MSYALSNETAAFIIQCPYLQHRYSTTDILLSKLLISQLRQNQRFIGIRFSLVSKNTFKPHYDRDLENSGVSNFKFFNDMTLRPLQINALI